MKLLKSVACLAAADGGNVKRQTVMGDASMDGFSDRGSIPLRSTHNREHFAPYFSLQFFLEKV